MLGLTRRELETELRDGLRHRQRAKAVGNCYSPIPKATAPVLDPTCEGVGVKFPRATRPLIHSLNPRDHSTTCWDGAKGA